MLFDLAILGDGSAFECSDLGRLVSSSSDPGPPNLLRSVPNLPIFTEKKVLCPLPTLQPTLSLSLVSMAPSSSIELACFAGGAACVVGAGLALRSLGMFKYKPPKA